LFFFSSFSSPLYAWVRLSKAFCRCCSGKRGGKGIGTLGMPSVVVIGFFFAGFWFSFSGEV